MKIIRIKTVAISPKLCILFAFFPFYLGMTILPIVSSAIDMLLDIWLVIAFFLLLINCLTSGIRLSKFLMLCLVYCCLLLISTVLQCGDFFRAVKVVVNILMIVLLSEYGLRKKCDFFIDFVTKITIVFTVINIISLFMFPDGIPVFQDGKFLPNRFFLGMDNRFCCTLFPGLCFVLLHDIRKTGKIGYLSWIEYGMQLFTFLYTQAMASLLSTIIILPLLLIIRTRLAKNIFHGLSYFVIQTVSAWLITFVRIFEKMGPLLNMLGKDVTLSSRTYLWNKANAYISEHWLLGMGIESIQVTKEKFAFTHLHNQFLTVIYQSGVIGLVLFLSIVGHVYRKLFKERNNLAAQAVALMLFLLFVQLFTDTVDNVRNHLFWVMAVGANIDLLVSGNKSNEEYSLQR